MNAIVLNKPSETSPNLLEAAIHRKDEDILDLLIVIQRIPAAWAAGQSLSGGPLTLASYIHSKGHNVKVLDNNSIFKTYKDDEILEAIAREEPTVVGMSVNMLNAFASYELAKKIKTHFPKIFLIAGGLHTFDEPEEVAEHSYDITFVGEAELSLQQFMALINKQEGVVNSSLLVNEKFLEALRSIPGLVVNRKGELAKTGPYEILKNLDELPFVNHDLMNLDDFIRVPSDHLRVTNLVNFQRGCPFKCTFCKAEFMGGKVRENSAEYMVKALTYLHEKYAQGHFVLNDSNFTMKRSRVLEFCKQMISSGLSEKITFWIQTSIIVSMRDDDLILLKKAGLSRISFGVERFTPEARESIGKSGTQEQVFEMLRKIKKHGLRNEINILINLPNETAESLAIEASHIEKTLPFVDYVLVNYLVPIPGTAMYESGSVKRKWYLDKEINYKKTSYYDQVFQINSPGLEFNLFGLTPEILKANRKFKEELYIGFQSKLYSFPFLLGSLLFQIMLRTDVLLGRISYFLYFHVSPSVESVVFWPLSTLREVGVKYFLSAWYHRTERRTKVMGEEVKVVTGEVV